MHRSRAFQLSLRRVLALGVSLSAGLWLLSGCAMNQTESSNPPLQLAMSGVVRGGNQPVFGTTVQLFTPGTTGYGSAATPVSLATTTDLHGSFNIPQPLTCPSSSSLVYMTATGGNPGLATGTNNTQIAEIAALGICGNLQPTTFVVVSELTTVAAVWAFSPFMIDSFHIGTSATNMVGLQNAFVSAGELASTSVAGGFDLPSSLTEPVMELNTLSNILAFCVNSAGGAAGDSSPCGKLMSAVTPTGGTAPTDTVGAALKITQNPGLNVVTLYNFVTTNGPFQPTLSAPPNDWTVTIFFTNPTVAGKDPLYVAPIAVDENQHIWTANGPGTSSAPLNAVFEFDQDFSFLSPTSGYTDSSLLGPYGLAFDPAGHLWVANAGLGNTNSTSLTELGADGTLVRATSGGGVANSFNVVVDTKGNIWAANSGLAPSFITDYGVSEFGGTGTALSPSNGYYTGGITYDLPGGLAVAQNGNVWIAASNDIAVEGPLGTAVSGSGGYSGGGYQGACYLAFDGNGNLWAPTCGESTVAAFHSNGLAFSPGSGFTGGGMSGVYAVAVDGANHIWLTNGLLLIGVAQTAPTAYLVELNAAGNPLSPAAGLGVNSLYTPSGIAIDASGNIWTTAAYMLAKCISCAVPVVTPISVATANGMLGTRP
jgi:sugar lactone lactonase YvrE